MSDDAERLIPVTNSNLERISATIALNCYAVILLCFMAIIITAVTMLLPGAVPIEKQIFVGLACLMVFSVVLVLICARRNPSALTTWTWMASGMACLLIGISFMILVPHVVK